MKNILYEIVVTTPERKIEEVIFMAIAKSKKEAKFLRASEIRRFIQRIGYEKPKISVNKIGTQHFHSICLN